MKTSNKLLIAFASALLLIPILGMVYISQVKYKVGKYTDIVDRKIENFSTATKNMTSIALATPFTSINVADAKQLTINVRFIKDEKFGIKIPTELKDLITATVDANGQLQLVIKSQKEKSERNNYTDIYVYAPNLKEVSVDHANDAYLTASVDSIRFNVKNTGTVSLGSGAHVNYLNISTTDVERLSFREDDVKSVTANLNNTNFRSESNSYDYLSIATNGKCEIDIIGDYNNENKQVIKNLVLNTVGKAEVKLENIKAINCAGSFSDQTMVQMPAANINQMYNKK
jgi:hypothetical protein